jgi:hypothetical protein
LLRVLESKRLVRVGSNKEIDVDVRVIAATHCDLAAMAKAGAFREDLRFRLDALTLRVLPLRERREEIGPLAELLLKRAAEPWGAGERTLSEDALAALQGYAWPRECQAAEEHAGTGGCGVCWDMIELKDLPEQIWAEGPARVWRGRRVPFRLTIQRDRRPRSVPFRTWGGSLSRLIQGGAGQNARNSGASGQDPRGAEHWRHACGLLGASDSML